MKIELPKITADDRVKLLTTLKSRFEKNTHRHPHVSWEQVAAKLEANPGKLWSLQQMEASGGEPDLLAKGKSNGELHFYDCAAESPAGRRSVCYDREGLESRKDHPPADTAIDMAAEMGIELLTEEQYRHLQEFGKFDTKTSSWIKTPAPIRKLGGAIFGDFRYGQVFIYHNGAQSYYAGRAFRGMLQLK